MAPLIEHVFVVGPAAHGKSTLRGQLTSILGVKGASCSDSLYSLWSYLDGRSEHELRSLHKEAARPTLIALGDWITGDGPKLADGFPSHLVSPDNLWALEQAGFPRPNPAALIQMAVQAGVSVLDGIRRRRELQEALRFYAWFGVKPLIVWVENPRVGYVKDNLDITRDDAEKFVFNAGSVRDLEDQARKIASELKAESY